MFSWQPLEHPGVLFWSKQRNTPTLTVYPKKWSRRFTFVSFGGDIKRLVREPLKISLSAIGSFLVSWVIPSKPTYITPQVERKKKEMNVEKSYKSARACPMFLTFFPSLRGPPEVWHHMQLDTIIIEVSPVKGLSLRGNILRLYRAKHWP